MEDAISRLRRERTSLQSRLEKVETAISEYDRWAVSVADLVGGVEKASPVQSPEYSHIATGPTLGNDTHSSIAEFEDSVRLVLGGATEPYPRGPLLSAIEELGVTVIGKDPANTMGTRLSRMSDIINLKGYGYWIASRPFPRAGYNPEKEDTEGRDNSILF